MRIVLNRFVQAGLCWLLSIGAVYGQNTRLTWRQTYESHSLNKYPAYRYDVQTRQWAVLHHVTPAGYPIYYVHRSNAAAAAEIGTSQVRAFNTPIALNGQQMQGRLGIWEVGSIRTTHQELRQRVFVRDQTTFPGGIPNANNHAVHVATTIIGQGVNAAAQGMAPQAQLEAYNTQQDLTEMAQAAAQGMLISCHAYGAIFPTGTQAWRLGYYNAAAADWDMLCENRPFYLPIQAVGNDRSSAGNQYDLLHDFVTAKNPLAVGANKGNQLADFSSTGPTDDGRIKPDLIAPGADILSAAAADDQAYQTLGGTSMAAAVVTGSLLLVQQAHLQWYNQPLTAAALKALAIHTASPIGTQPIPNYRVGWGQLNTQAALAFLCTQQRGSLLVMDTLANGQTYTQTLQTSSTQALRATLVWTDPAATPLPENLTSFNNRTPRLVNDLDLRLLNANGSIVASPWVLNPAAPEQNAQTGDNRVDVVEQIVYSSQSPNTTYTLRIAHKGTLQDQNGLARNHQSFALVISGLAADSLQIRLENNLLKANLPPQPTDLQWEWLREGVPMNTQTATTFVPAEPGNYQLRIRTYCGQTLLSNIIRIGEDFQPIRLFPNPAANFIIFDAPTQSPVKVIIYNMQGKQMAVLSFVKSKEVITNYWPSGTYIAFVEYEGRQYTHKFIKN